MGRLLVALGPGVGMTASQLAEAWDSDEAVRASGAATVEEPAPGIFGADLLALVVIPLAVNVGSSAAYDMVRGLISKLRPKKANPPELELIEIEGSDGDRVIVVRVRGELG